MNTHLPFMKLIKPAILLLAVIFMMPFILEAQDDNSTKNIKKRMHFEVPQDKYLPAEARETSPAYRFESSTFFTTQVNIDSDGNNIVDDAANEPSIAIDPTNPDRMVIGWRQFDNISSNFRQAGYAYSLDGGQSWTFPGVIEPGVFRSDPVIDVDTDGTFYYNSLTRDANDDFICNVYKAGGNDVVWDEGTYAHGGDKQWMHIDRTGGPGTNNNYSFWTSYWSVCYPGAFTRSTDMGTSYEDCVVVSGDPSWGTLATGPDSELYIVGAGSWSGIVVAKSTNAQDPGATVAWDSYNYVELDGELTGWTMVNPAGLLGQAWIDVDVSGGPGHGNVYVCASVDRNSNNDPGDVMFAKSTDGGQTWEDPIRINDDAGTTNYQWFGTMSVAPNGRIDVVWLDTRDMQVNAMSALYYSYSIDEGETWSENEKLSEVFDPHVGWPQQEKMGDYYDMVSDNEGAHLAWAHTLNGEQDVNYAFIKPLFTSIEDLPEEQVSLSLRSYPNPVVTQTNIRYKLNESVPVELVIRDVYGKEVSRLVNEVQDAGIHKVVFTPEGLSDGIYYCHLHAGRHTETIKLMLVR